jgi:hypothetical protein
MKVRSGFVSNSSSSSFICDACGENVSGWDMGLSEAEMRECEGGHTYCISHETTDWLPKSVNERRDALVRYYSHDKQYIEKFNICLEEEIEEAYENNRYDIELYGAPSEQCPCCNLSNIDKDNKKAVQEEMRTLFGTTQKMYEAINK